jgi:hypothetical protein
MTGCAPAARPGSPCFEQLDADHVSLKDARPLPMLPQQGIDNTAQTRDSGLICGGFLRAQLASQSKKEEGM